MSKGFDVFDEFGNFVGEFIPAGSGSGCGCLGNLVGCIVLCWLLSALPALLPIGRDELYKAMYRRFGPPLDRLVQVDNLRRVACSSDMSDCHIGEVLIVYTVENKSRAPINLGTLDQGWLLSLRPGETLYRHELDRTCGVARDGTLVQISGAEDYGTKQLCLKLNMGDKTLYEALTLCRDIPDELSSE